MRNEPERDGGEDAMLRVNEYHHALTLDQIREFVEGSRTIGFAAPKREAIYEFIERVLRSQQYRRISRGQKGIVRRFLAKMSGLSRAQLTRWIGRWMKTRRVK